MIINIIYNFLIIHFIEPLAELNNLPNIIQGIGLALLTILIPLAIAILPDIYKKRGKELGVFTASQNNKIGKIVDNILYN